MEFSASNDGALVGQSFFNKPGRKKLAGETLCEVLMPLQPEKTNGNAASNTSGKKFHLNRTCRV
jgi:hypothetical protein